MDKLTDYPQLIERILTDYISLCNRNPNRPLETFLIADRDQGHYIWMTLGWQNGNRTTGMTVYVRLQNGKFSIEEDWTENGIANDLLEAGVPKEDIILAFQDPQMQPYTGFATESPKTPTIALTS
ncbi:XisI protein [Alkalinema sp. FACHB-956]|uniref:XisI protein n=1 Tax=Alkalinema sp. FACHB-956 TaxID=2692768 RepID=UPI0016871687|nr:XisI protein [Alkalinema sp. FACHB-956]MBD2327567.1 XisI protein [Alkalinema sp. FACHB-956]